MTDRYSTLTVVLEKDIRQDDAESLMNAIRHLRGVLSVGGDVADTNAYVAEFRARAALEGRILAALRGD